MRILVVHPHLSVIGGAEQVLVNVLEALAERKHKIFVIGKLPKADGFEKIARADITQIPYGPFWFEFKRFQAHQKLLLQPLFLMDKLRRKIRYADLEIMTQDPIFSLGVGKWKVAYVHFPENLQRLEGANPRLKKFWKVFYLPIMLRLRQQVNKIDLLLCNSEYTRKAILTRWGRTAEVVYPPADVEDFHLAPKENFVVSVGRFVPTKNYETIIHVAKLMPDLQFLIIGRKHTQDAYYEKIKKLKPANVELLTDVRRLEMVSILSKAKIYLHAMIGEHFGISVVEAMAAGCIPIIHNSGGTKEAIGNLGYVYNTLPECVDCIYRALDSKTEPEKIAEHARMFSSENFKKSLINALKIKSFL